MRFWFAFKKYFFVDFNTHYFYNFCIWFSVLQNVETMQLLLQSLGACEGSSVAIILDAVGDDVSEKLGLGETVTDALYQLLLCLNNKATSSNLILTPLITFITQSKFISPVIFKD